MLNQDHKKDKKDNRKSEGQKPSVAEPCLGTYFCTETYTSTQGISLFGLF